MSIPNITLSEYDKRRKAVLRSLKDAVGLVLAGPHAVSLHHRFRAHAHFEYLTGIADEPDAAFAVGPEQPAG